MPLDLYVCTIKLILKPTRDNIPTDHKTRRKIHMTVLLLVFMDANALHPFSKQPKHADQADIMAK
jgi:hypothetical protein